jgi:diguanylate cyclase (GGDEF)-like protein
LDYQWWSEGYGYAFTADDLRRLVRQGGILDQLHSYERQRANGTVIEVCSQPLKDGGLVRTYTDVTLRKQAEQKLTYLAYHDELTGLSNRYALREQVDKTIPVPGGTANNPALFYVDLDRFKLVNDICGHSAGDEVLKQAGQRLRGALGAAGMVARLGGDEFAVLLPHNGSRETALVYAEHIKGALSGQYMALGHAVRIGLSIGIALYPEDGTTTDELLRSADSALHRAKASGRDAIRLHDNAAEQEDLGRMMLEQDFRFALEQEQFELLYQPIFDSQTDLPSACEALLRWRHPTRGLLFPDLFIPIAEKTGLIKPLGKWVLDTACKEAATWALPVRIAVNLSSLQLLQADLEQQVVGAIVASGLSAHRLDLEVTESVLLSDTAHVRGMMLALQSHGIRLVMDDFGTGHSSLKALQGFPFEQIKIDRSFVARIIDDERTSAILTAVLSMAAKMKLEVVAEGVSTAAQMEALRNLGCRFMQGFMLGRPQTPEWIQDYFWRCTRSRVENTIVDG